MEGVLVEKEEVGIVETVEKGRIRWKWRWIWRRW